MQSYKLRDGIVVVSSAFGSGLPRSYQHNPSSARISPCMLCFETNKNLDLHGRLDSTSSVPARDDIALLETVSDRSSVLGRHHRDVSVSLG